jgi:hypothetical protein
MPVLDSIRGNRLRMTLGGFGAADSIVRPYSQTGVVREAL